jgi:hypothetical protein
MSWTVTASNAASAAENRPVYTFFSIFRTLKVRAKTHEDKHSIGISFPTFRPLLILFLDPFEIHRK